MRIYDSDNDTITNTAVVYLTMTEAKELADDLNAIISNPKGNHAHVSSAEYQEELTICIYDAEDIEEFDDNSKRIINGGNIS